MPTWLQLIIAVGSVLGAGFGGKVIDWMFSREGRLWTEIGALRTRIEHLEQMVDRLISENASLKLLNGALKGEVNDLLGEMGRSEKYPTETK